MTRDKKRYIEALLYNYKNNKARLQILELVCERKIICRSMNMCIKNIYQRNVWS